MKLFRIGLAAAGWVAIYGSAFAGNATYVSDQVIVKFKSNATQVRAISHATIGASVGSEIAPIGVQVVTLPKGVTVDRALRYYRGLSSVEYAEPNYIQHAFYTPNDPRYNEQYAHVKLNMPKAWDLSLGDAKVIIAIIDSGVDYTHPDLSGKVILGKDFANNDNDPMDDNGHGTHCAGIAAAKTNNGIGGAGVGFNCAILAEKTLNAGGSGNASWSAAAIVDAADRGAKVISLSLGGAGNLKAQEDAVSYAWSKGAVVVAAAGNSNVSTKFYPAGYEKAIAVGATDQNDAKASFSNFGADWVDVAAPGVGILSTVPNGGYEAWDGTSMACPVVSGLVGLMFAYSPTSTNVEVRSILESTTDNVGTWIAKGRVNGFRAVNNLIKPVMFDFPGKTATVYAENGFTQGRNLSGGVANLAKKDSAFITVDSVLQPGVGRLASLSTSLTMTASQSKLRSATLDLAAKAPSGVTVQFFAKNFSTGKYELLQSVPGNGAVATQSLDMKNIANYLSGTRMDLVVRGYVSLTRSAADFKLSVDVVNMHVVANP